MVFSSPTQTNTGYIRVCQTRRNLLKCVNSVNFCMLRCVFSNPPRFSASAWAPGRTGRCFLTSKCRFHYRSSCRVSGLFGFRLFKHIRPWSLSSDRLAFESILNFFHNRSASLTYQKAEHTRLRLLLASHTQKKQHPEEDYKGEEATLNEC